MEWLTELYDNSTVRRQDRLLDTERAIELLRGGEYGFLALGGRSGYGIPISFALAGLCIYFHCAPEGEKLRRIAQGGRVCFCVVGQTAPEPAMFTTGYESVLAFGAIRTVDDDTERSATSWTSIRPTTAKRGAGTPRSRSTARSS